MRNTQLVAIFLCLSGCQNNAPLPIEKPMPPVELQVCPDPAYPPVVPPIGRSIEQIVIWAKGVDYAWVQTEAARKECSRRLDSLNKWIFDHE